ncbi:MAG: YggS family pyridoxal phosphate-dependent enzyme [Rikenellaceae bacterium]|jgi:pyridoxal phosphate enzyme (YggS family)|nr:YggS family pyridoxal phosphate-dependent enzyme [Rikenellaceae bacterium]
MSIAEKIRELRARLPEGVTLVAVSKFHPPQVIREAYDAGQRIFAESRAQELREKYELLPKDIEWHFIGTMQTNKVKYYAPFVTLIQSVDSEKALQVIQKEAARNARTIDVLLEVHIACEASKQGFSPDELRAYFASGAFRELPNVRFRGLMGMASLTGDTQQIAAEFARLHDLFEELKTRYAVDFGGVFDTLSMGMTDDWPQAVEAGSTMVRIGSYLFGQR